MIGLSVEHGILGKAPGARSDFRWLALSKNFNTRRFIERQALLGAEDKPCQGYAWQVSGNYFYAMTMYPSRSVDQAGRSGFLEKQFLQVYMPNEVHPGLLALMLAEKLLTLNDRIWWDQGQTTSWQDVDFSLALKPFSIEWDEHRLTKAVHNQLADFITRIKTKSIEYDTFVRAFSLLLANKPAYYYAEQTLAFSDLVCLLLLLPTDKAKITSLASWVPSQRINREQLAKSWSFLALGKQYQIIDLLDQSIDQASVNHLQVLMDLDRYFPTWIASRLQGVQPEDSTHSTPQSMVEYVQFTVPYRPGLKIALSPLPDHLARKTPILMPLFRFAQEIDQRFFDLDKIALKSLSPEAKQMIKCWEQEVRDQQPNYVDGAQWEHKLAILQELTQAPY